jgi:energy-coupling factor transporter ATP-binding protein EcfA2
MLTKLKIRNFKRFDNVEVELGNPVVFIGPNNSGKTSALQALALWQVGLSRWNEKRKGKGLPEKRPGVTINRRDLVAVPVPGANLLWKNLHVRELNKSETGLETQNVFVDIIVEGVSSDKRWECGLEFYYANEESFYCRPLRLPNGSSKRMVVPDEAADTLVAFLPPMSGLSANETRLDQGAINVRVGEGQTAAVLRNLCYSIHSNKPELWQRLVEHIRTLFGSVLKAPRYIPERGELEMTYSEGNVTLDLSSSGRGLQQTLLLLAYMFANPNSVLLLDEPDAHLEILRQRQIYQLLTDAARINGNQIIAASHSEVLLNEAAGRDLVIAFVGNQPHAINDRGSQVLKALKEIGFEQYYQAEETGWVLYLEGSTDLAILKAFAERLNDEPSKAALALPFVHYVGNQPSEVRKHFHGLREAAPRLRAIAIFDRLEAPLPTDLGAVGLMWEKREIENYLSDRETLEAYARHTGESSVAGPLFSEAESGKRLQAMTESIEEMETALRTLGKGSPWDPNLKASDEFLTPLFQNYFRKLGIPNLMAKKDFYELASFVPQDKIDSEIVEKLAAIVAEKNLARPRGSEN